MIRVVVQASTPALRAGLSAMLVDDDFEIAADDAPDASDVIVTANAATELAGLVREDHTQAVVVMSGDATMATVLRAMPLKGWAVVPLDTTPGELRAAVLAASHGFAVLSPSMVIALATNARETATINGSTELEQSLTPREVEVLELVSRGLPSKLIARDLDVSESTVKFHLSSIYNKLGASSRTEAVSRAARLGLITL